MSNDILDSLDDLGYSGPLLEEAVLDKAIEGGATSIEYSKLVAWLTTELGSIVNVDERVNPITSADDADTFLMELSGFLREFGCPYAGLTEGALTQRLATRENKTQLLDYLLTELQAVRIISVTKPNLYSKAEQKTDNASVECSAADSLKAMLIALSFPKPPAGITAFQLFSKVESKVKELLGKVPSTYLGPPLLKASLSERQWKDVQNVNEILKREYECRREMVLKRLDVTVQSFKWSDRAKEKEDKIAAVYQPIRRGLSSQVCIDMADVLAARSDLTIIEKTSSSEEREKTKCAINRVKIGNVPDRGGRVNEMEPPPPEMPSFQKRQPGSAGGRGRGGHRGGGQWSGGGHRGGGSGGGQQGWLDGGGQQGQGNWGQCPVAMQPTGTPGAAQQFFGGEPRKMSFGAPCGYQPTNQAAGHQGGGYQGEGYHGGGYQGGGYQGRGGQRGGRSASGRARGGRR